MFGTGFSLTALPLWATVPVLDREGSGDYMTYTPHQRRSLFKQPPLPFPLILPRLITRAGQGFTLRGGGIY
jgi:hypothetical protein